MSKRLAITISGAVSLGSYEAGVLYEVLRAIGEHNEHPDTLSDPSSRIDVDVLTGASAGGMTAAVAAQVLLGGAGRLPSAENNAFHQPWVRDVDLVGLPDAKPSLDPPSHSILASSHVEEIARKSLPVDPKEARHPAAPSSSPIELGLAMSNLNGIDYNRTTITPSGPGEFTYTQFQDTFSWELISAKADWVAIREAALACGAFPFAFRARGIRRRKPDYPGANASNFPDSERLFTYLDGGIFQNEPLGLAKRLADKRDDLEHKRDRDDRFYLFVAPRAKSGVSIEPDKLNPKQMTLYRSGGALLTSIYYQSQFQDWITAEKTNRQLDRLNQNSAVLGEKLVANPALASELDGAVRTLLRLFYDDGSEQEELDRIAALFQRLDDSTGKNRDFASELDSERAAVWHRCLLLLERAAGLENKDEMRIYTITATDEELGGELLFAFAGFIDEKIRQHDYDVGRTKAREWLQSGSGGLFPIRAKFEEAPPKIDPKYGRWEMRQFDKARRKELRSPMLERLDQLMVQAGLGWLTRKGVLSCVLKKHLNRLLGL